MITIKEAEEILKKEYHVDNFLYVVNELLLPDFRADKHDVDFKNTIFTSVQQLGYSDKCDVNVYEVILNEGAQNRRVTITQEMFRILRGLGVNNAIVAFSNADRRNYRFSLLTSKYEFDGEKVVKVLSNPRRYSYSLGYGTKTKTAYDFLIGKGKVNSLDELINRFSVEVVNKQFYNEIALAFTKLVGGQRDGKTFEKELNLYGVTDQNKYAEFAVRLIGRIVFCWFLKEKKSENGIPLIPESMLALDSVKTSRNYYHDTLEPLFFELLNTNQPRRKGKFAREEIYTQIPYLNGGLFSPHADDHYKFAPELQTGQYGLVTIPNGWFEHFYEILGQYNFTVDENTSYDIELSIDPEMLGRIFENLLAEINPETGENAKKSTGSFYTPRDIVDYMVDSSILEHLKAKTGIDEAKLRALISYGKEDDELATFSMPEKKALINALYTVTVLDPACGSGAFPIGMLQKIVYMLQEIDPEANLWFDKATENISFLMRKEFEKKFNAGSLDYIRKLTVIQNSIFGVDIQPIAVEIARLRCFLSLVIEEKVYDDEPNRGINPLPNLDFKFIIANTLISLPHDSDYKKDVADTQLSLFERQDHISQLKNVREEYFSVNDSETKTELKNEFTEIQNAMFQEALDNRKFASARYQALFQWKPFKNEVTNWFDPEWMFGVKDGFDIVIGNPPYIKERDAKEIFAPIINTVWGKKWHQGKMDYWYYFLHKAMDLTNKSGKICFITPRYWLNSTGAKKLILRIKQELSFRSFIDIGNIKTFENVAGYHMIALYDKQNQNDEFIYKQLHNLDGISSTQTTESVEVKTLSKSKIITPKGQIIISDDNFTSPNCLGNYYSVSQGVVEASDRISKNMYNKTPDPMFSIGDGIFVLSDFEIEDINLTSEEEKVLKRYLDGKDVSRYSITFDNRYLIYSDAEAKERIRSEETFKNIRAHLNRMAKYITSSNAPYGIHRARKKQNFESEKLISPSMFKLNQFAYDADGFYVGMSFNVINQINDEYSLRYLCGILNSKFALYWFYQNGKHRGAGVDIGVDKLRDFPMPEEDPIKANEIDSIVMEIITLKRNKADTCVLEDQIDKIVYELYDLSAEEVTTVEEFCDKLRNS
jgi:adenine-specific DNA-methyltransferase